MTFKVLIIEDNHSFIDSLKVMLRDLPLDFIHAFRYADAQLALEKHGVFHNRQAAQDPAAIAAEQVEAIIDAVTNGNKKRTAIPNTNLYNDGGVFLIIVEQNTETSMKGTDFINHALRKFPGLSEGDFILLTHRQELVLAKNHNFPVLEKPLRTPQLRQVVSQKIKQAQDLVDMQARVEAQKIDKSEKQPLPQGSKRKGLRDLLKMKRRKEESPASKSVDKKSVKKQKKASPTKPVTKKSTRLKKARPK